MEIYIVERILTCVFIFIFLLIVSAAFTLKIPEKFKDGRFISGFRIVEKKAGFLTRLIIAIILAPLISISLITAITLPIELIYGQKISYWGPNSGKNPKDTLIKPEINQTNEKIESIEGSNQNNIEIVEQNIQIENDSSQNPAKYTSVNKITEDTLQINQQDTVKKKRGFFKKLFNKK
ncbi:MAG: hypothetical protein SFY32_10705 [Bacteroidota bacterium]|nr:hypothetical protein [Bacteroidota bacterium]